MSNDSWNKHFICLLVECASYIVGEFEIQCCSFRGTTPGSMFSHHKVAYELSWFEELNTTASPCQHKCLSMFVCRPRGRFLSANFRLSRTGALWEQIWGCHVITNPVRSILYFVSRVVSCLRDDSGGKFSILGRDSVGHCEENSSYEHACSSE